ncbi:uncharacterized protein LOC134196204 [Corticium candelabrum]|uniref:uncharacterized protein LOC134196204 n=1 Tax=Corticium candelabrum TaxID=121492 RepID=UPI002E25D295|nr:uncharacterized protein LOC134196204 [Corticium candelabrum]
MQLKVQRAALHAVFELICENEANQRTVVTHSEFISTIFKLMQTSVDREAMQWLVFIIHQLTTSANSSQHLLTEDLLPPFAKAANFCQGDLVLTRYCLESIVTHFVTNDTGPDQISVPLKVAKLQL